MSEEHDSWLQGIGVDVAGFVGCAAQTVETGASRAVETVQNAASTVAQATEQTLGGVSQVVSQAWNSATSAVKQVYDDVGKAARETYDSVIKTAQQIGEPEQVANDRNPFLPWPSKAHPSPKYVTNKGNPPVTQEWLEAQGYKWVRTDQIKKDPPHYCEYWVHPITGEEVYRYVSSSSEEQDPDCDDPEIPALKSNVDTLSGELEGIFNGLAELQQIAGDPEYPEDYSGLITRWKHFDDRMQVTRKKVADLEDGGPCKELQEQISRFRELNTRVEGRGKEFWQQMGQLPSP